MAMDDNILTRNQDLEKNFRKSGRGSGVNEGKRLIEK